MPARVGDPRDEGTGCRDTGPGDPRPVPPVRPAPAECCEAGCDRCVFDVYAEELEAFRAALAAWLVRHPDAAAELPRE